MSDCLTCAEIEAKICALADEIAAGGSCSGPVIKEGGITFDYSAELKTKTEVLKVYKEMFRLKCRGAGELYEFVHVPCVKPTTCVSGVCRKPVRTRRRYRG